MGKIKETLLNNLSPEEMHEKMLGELSAFEYVEYVEKYKNKNWKQLSLFDDNGDPISDEVLDSMYSERNRLEQEYWEQEYIKELNESMRLKYSDNDIMDALDSIGISIETKSLIQSKLDDVWASKNGF